MNLEKVASQTTDCGICDGKSATGAFLLKVRSIMSQPLFLQGGMPEQSRPQRINGSWLFQAMFRQLVAVATKLRSRFSFKVAVGYEDESGFNYGVAPAPQAKTGCRSAIIFAVFGGLVATVPFQAKASASQGVITLAWKASSSPAVAGYNIYYGSQLGSYTKIYVGNVTNATVSGINLGVRNYFVVTTVNTLGMESLPSNEVSYLIPSLFSLAIQMIQGNPASVIITSTGTTPPNWVLESSSDLSTWTTTAQGTNTPVSVSMLVAGTPPMFFRLRD